MYSAPVSNLLYHLKYIYFTRDIRDTKIIRKPMIKSEPEVLAAEIIFPRRNVSMEL
jgi:hypothetical protein